MFGQDPLNAHVYSMILGPKYKKGLNTNLGDAPTLIKSCFHYN
jgi:hypothetical protein